jgi:hypothetical protein
MSADRQMTYHLILVDALLGKVNERLKHRTPPPGRAHRAKAKCGHPIGTKVDSTQPLSQQGTPAAPTHQSLSHRGW